MSGFEELIRDTIAKQGEPTHAVRTRVYASARSALERMIAARGEDEAAAGQRDALEAAIGRIEAEHAAPAAPLPDPVARPAPRTSHYAPDPVPDVPVSDVPVSDVARSDAPVRAPTVGARSPAELPTPTRAAAPSVIVEPPRAEPRRAQAPRAEAPRHAEPRITEPRVTEPTGRAEPTARAEPTIDPGPPPRAGPIVDPGPLEPVDYASGVPPAIDPATDPALDPAVGRPAVAPARPRDIKAEARARREADRLLDGRPRRRPWVLLLLWTIVLAGLATAAWWGWNFGRSTIESIAIPPEPSEIISAPPRVGQTDEGWASLFDPAADIASVVADGGTSELIDGPRGPVLRIATVGEGTGVAVRVPPGVMQGLRGGPATFEVTARAAEGSHSFVVMCEFGTEAGCGRRRFSVGAEPTAFLFDADMTEAAGNGTILFVPDIEGNGRAIDILGIRARSG